MMGPPSSSDLSRLFAMPLSPLALPSDYQFMAATLLLASGKVENGKMKKKEKTIYIVKVAVCGATDLNLK